LLGHIQRDRKESKPTSFANGKLWMLDTGYAKKGGERGAIAQEEKAGFVLLRKGSKDFILQGKLMTISELLRFRSDDSFDLLNLLTLNDILYYSDIEISINILSSCLYDIPFIIQDFLILLSCFSEFEEYKLRIEALLNINDFDDEVIFCQREEWEEFVFENISLEDRAELVAIIINLVRDILFVEEEEDDFENQTLSINKNLVESLIEKLETIESDYKKFILDLFKRKPSRYLLPIWLSYKSERWQKYAEVEIRLIGDVLDGIEDIDIYKEKRSSGIYDIFKKSA